MSDSEQHEMHLEATYPTGVEEWYCPTCGRRVIMQWPPNFKRVILEPGDQYAIHMGGKGGLRMGLLQVGDGEETEPAEKLSLSSWEAWLADVDLGGTEAQ